MNSVNTASLHQTDIQRPAKALRFRLVADQDNHEHLLDLAEAGHRESRFGYIPFSRDKARRVLTRALAEDHRHLIAVAEVGRRVEGFVFASAGEYVYGSAAVIVTINTIYTSPNLRKSLLGGRAALGLFTATGKWAKGIGAREILLHATSGIGPQRVERTAGRLGFSSIGGCYVAQLNYS